MIKENFRLREKTYNCYFELTIDLIGGKWKPVILYHIGQVGVLRYAEIKKCIPKITERMLSKQLKELEADDIVIRKVYPVVPPKVEYSLTEKGKTLIPLLFNLTAWGETYFKDNIDMFDVKKLEQED